MRDHLMARTVTVTTSLLSTFFAVLVLRPCSSAGKIVIRDEIPPRSVSKQSPQILCFELWVFWFGLLCYPGQAQTRILSDTLSDGLTINHVKRDVLHWKPERSAAVDAVSREEEFCYFSSVTNPEYTCYERDPLSWGLRRLVCYSLSSQQQHPPGPQELLLDRPCT